jgi:IS30 family transposase
MCIFACCRPKCWARCLWATLEEVARIIRWINHYPRRILGGKISNDLFGMELEKILA